MISTQQVGPHAGRLSQFSHVWKSLTKDSAVLSWVKGVSLQFFSKPKQTIEPSVKIAEDQRKNYEHSLQKLLTIGCIESCCPVEGQFISSYFLIKKPNGEDRFILNLKKLNTFIQAPHFKLEDYRTVLKLLNKSYFLSKIDLKDAYYLVPIRKKDRKYLRFRFNNILYQFNSMPFGLNIAPYIFTKILKPVVKILRLRGIVTIFYLDDILIIGDDRNECQKNTLIVVNLLQSLGFIVNWDKSILTPQQKIKYLGFNYDTINMRISLPNGKIRVIQNLINEFKKENKKHTLKDFAMLIGKFVASCPATEYGFTHIKPFEKTKYASLRENSFNYYTKIIIPKYLWYELDWWKNNVGLGQDIKNKPFSCEIFSDASQTGWGAFCEGSSCHGFWDNQEAKMHINFLEIKAAYYALKSFTKSKTHIHVLLRIDNQTAISCINRGGSVRYSYLNNIVKELWNWCEERRILIFASYISSAANFNADRESRSISIDTEYELNIKIFQKIIHKFGHPDIDLFATRLNKKCPRFISWFPDPESFSIDAFTVNWSKYYFYAFPPFSIITKVLEKIIQDRALGILVVPYWPTQPWFPLYNKLLVTSPLTFQPEKYLLISPFRKSHPLHKEISLVAGKLSGEPFSKKEFL